MLTRLGVKSQNLKKIRQHIEFCQYVFPGIFDVYIVVKNKIKDSSIWRFVALMIFVLTRPDRKVLKYVQVLFQYEQFGPFYNFCTDIITKVMGNIE